MPVDRSCEWRSASPVARLVCKFWRRESMLRVMSLERFGKVACLAAVLVLVLAAFGCGRGSGSQGGGEEGQTYTIKLSHVVATDTPKGLAAEKFKELAEQKSDGRITVEVYPNSQLYGDEDEMQAVQSGGLQMIAPTTSKFTTIAPKMQVLDFPFIYDNYDELDTVTAPETPVGQIIYENEKLSSNNIRVLALWVDGFKQIAANTPIRSPEDFQGLKIRVQPADVLRTMFETWGANPTTIAFGELYTALEQGVVNGHENPYSVIYGSKAHQVQPYITESSHGANVSVAAINQDFFDSLPEDLQQVVTEAADEAAAYNREIALKQNTEGKGQILEAGTTEIIELSPEQRQAFKEEVVPEVWDRYTDLVGEEAIGYLKEQQDSGSDVIEYRTASGGGGATEQGS
jgi:C4-dicarboxylate-binding protein DctP